MLKAVTTLIGLAIGALVTSALADVTLKGEDGSTAKEAIVILGAKDSTEGILAEYQVLSVILPGWQRTSQAVMNEDGKVYDVFVLTKGDSAREIYFDITSFFGK